MNKEEYKALVSKINDQLKEIAMLVEEATMDMNAASAIIDIDMLGFAGGAMHKLQIELQFVEKHKLKSIPLTDLLKDKEQPNPSVVVDDLFKEMNIKTMKKKKEDKDDNNK